MNNQLRPLVRRRGKFWCEYCHLPEFAVELNAFHIEHIVPKKHGGSTVPGNCAWSCNRCNFSKGTNLSGRDALTGDIVRLFNPRRQLWNRHFEWFGYLIVGRTRIGRATVATLNMNDSYRVDLRHSLIQEGEWRPD